MWQISKVLVSIVLLAIAALLLMYSKPTQEKTRSQKNITSIIGMTPTTSPALSPDIVTVAGAETSYTTSQVTQYTLIAFTDDTITVKKVDGTVEEIAYESGKNISLLDANGKTISSAYNLTANDINKKLILLVDLSAGSKKLVVYDQ